MEKDELTVFDIPEDEIIKSIIEDNQLVLVNEGVKFQTDYANKHGEHHISVCAKNYNEEVSFKEVPYKSRVNDDVKQPKSKKLNCKKNLKTAETEERSL